MSFDLKNGIILYLCILKRKYKRSLTNPVVKDEQTPFVNRKADGLPEAKATTGSVNFSFSLIHNSWDLSKNQNKIAFYGEYFRN